jgi:hypothetical protein
VGQEDGDGLTLGGDAAGGELALEACCFVLEAQAIGDAGEGDALHLGGRESDDLDGNASDLEAQARVEPLRSAVVGFLNDVGAKQRSAEAFGDGGGDLLAEVEFVVADGAGVVFEGVVEVDADLAEGHVAFWGALELIASVEEEDLGAGGFGEGALFADGGSEGLEAAALDPAIVGFDADGEGLSVDVIRVKDDEAGDFGRRVILRRGGSAEREEERNEE